VDDEGNLLSRHGVHGFGEIADVLGRDTSHAYASVARHVDVVLLRQLVDLLGSEPAVAEHSDLVGDVSPVSLGAEIMESLDESGSHRDDPFSHRQDLFFPKSSELGVREDGGHDSGAMDGRIRVHRSDKNLELALDGLRLIRVGTNDVESPDSLSVESKVLGEGLTDRNQVTILDEMTDGPSVSVRVS